MPKFENPEDYVGEQLGCPKCGETRTDYLEWLGDGLVKCLTCDTAYSPYDEIGPDEEGGVDD